MLQDINLVLNNYNTTFYLAICFLLAACSTTDGTKSFTPQTAAGDRAMVYVYRPGVMSNAIYSPELYINGERKLTLKNGQNSFISLPPGETTFEIEPDKNYSGLTRLDLNMVAGTTTFIRVDSSLKIENSASYEPYRRSFDLIQIDEMFAIRQITECCVNNGSKVNNALKSLPADINTDDGFSVDKTQNPFSH